jgi:hypothetical protein
MRFLPTLAILFVGLKLASIINWSWWLVLLPLYGPLAIIGIIFGASALGLGTICLAAVIGKKRR